VRRPIDLPVEAVVSDLVLPELGRRRQGGREEKGERERDLLHAPSMGKLDFK
jgi:hypothetical protein